MLLFYELCKDIYGGSPAMGSIDVGIESGNLVESSSRQSSSLALEHSADLLHSIELTPAIVKQQKQHRICSR